MEDLERYIMDILDYIERQHLELPPDIGLVLEHRNSGRWGYYFVDHKAQCLFWLDEFDAADFLSPVRVHYTPSLICQFHFKLTWSLKFLNLSIISRSWNESSVLVILIHRLHNEYFPDARPFPEAAVVELKDTILHAIGGIQIATLLDLYTDMTISADSLTSSSSIAPYDLETLQKMLEVVGKIEGQLFGIKLEGVTPWYAPQSSDPQVQSRWPLYVSSSLICSILQNSLASFKIDCSTTSVSIDGPYVRPPAYDGRQIMRSFFSSMAKDMLGLMQNSLSILIGPRPCWWSCYPLCCFMDQKYTSASWKKYQWIPLSKDTAGQVSWANWQMNGRNSPYM